MHLNWILTASFNLMTVSRVPGFFSQCDSCVERTGQNYNVHSASASAVEWREAVGREPLKRKHRERPQERCWVQVTQNRVWENFKKQEGPEPSPGIRCLATTRGRVEAYQYSRTEGEIEALMESCSRWHKRKLDGTAQRPQGCFQWHPRGKGDRNSGRLSILWAASLSP